MKSLCINKPDNDSWDLQCYAYNLATYVYYFRGEFMQNDAVTT